MQLGTLVSLGGDSESLGWSWFCAAAVRQVLHVLSVSCHTQCVILVSIRWLAVSSCQPAHVTEVDMIQIHQCEVKVL